jgi:cytochrome b561
MSQIQVAQSYSRVAKILHWAIAILIVPMLLFGEDLMEAEHGSILLPSVHASIGVTILALSVARLAWRLLLPVPALPAGTPAWENLTVRVVHFLFYVLMIGLPITGWLAVPRFLAEEHVSGIEAFGLELPIVPDLGFPAGAIHDFGGKIGIALIVLHVLAALKHHFVNRDNVLTRMLPNRN